MLSNDSFDARKKWKEIENKQLDYRGEFYVDLLVLSEIQIFSNNVVGNMQIC